MTVSFKSSSIRGVSDTQGLVDIPVPSEADVDDIVICFVGTWNEGANSVTPPPEFTKIVEAGPASLTRISAFWKRLSTPDTDSYTFEHSSGFANGNAECLSGGLVSGDPIEDFAIGSVTSSTYPDLIVDTTTEPFLSWGAYNESADSTHDVPNGYTGIAPQDYGMTAWLIPGTTGSHTATGATASSSMGTVNILVAVIPEPESSGVAGELSGSLPRLEGNFTGTVGPNELIYVADYSTGKFNQWQIIQNVFWNDPPDEPPGYTDTYAAAIVTTDLPAGVSYAARFEVRDGDIPFGDTERSEVQGPSYDSGGQEGNDRWYKWSTKFDPQFPQNHSLGFGLVAQFHDQSSGSPPLGMYVDVADNFWGLRVNEQSSPGVFVNNYILWMTSLDNGNWHEIKLHIVWSTDNIIGLVELWYDGVKQTFTGGPNSGTETTNIQTLTPGGGGIYYKQGYYRTGAAVETGIVSHFGYKVAPSEAVLDGTPSDVTGELSGSLLGLTGSFSGEVVVDGTISGNLPLLTGLLSGDIGLEGQLQGDLPSLTGSITGTIALDGELFGNLPALTGNFEGQVFSDDVVGELSGSLPGLDGSFDGLVGLEGSIDGALPSLIGSFSGVVGAEGQSVSGVVLDLAVSKSDLDLSVIQPNRLDMSVQQGLRPDLSVSVVTLNLSLQRVGVDLAVSMPTRIDLSSSVTNQLDLSVERPQ